MLVENFRPRERMIIANIKEVIKLSPVVTDESNEETIGHETSLNKNITTNKNFVSEVNIIINWGSIHNTCLLLTEFEVRTVSYGPSFFSLRFMAQARSARAINRRGGGGGGSEDP